MKMRKIIFLIILFSITPFLAQSEESGVKVQTNTGSFEVKTGTPNKPVETPVVVIEKTVVDPKGGCGCSLDSGAPCK